MKKGLINLTNKTIMLGKGMDDYVVLGTPTDYFLGSWGNYGKLGEDNVVGLIVMENEGGYQDYSELPSNQLSWGGYKDVSRRLGLPLYLLDPESSDLRKTVDSSIFRKKKEGVEHRVFRDELLDETLRKLSLEEGDDYHLASVLLITLLDLVDKNVYKYGEFITRLLNTILSSTEGEIYKEDLLVLTDEQRTLLGNINSTVLFPLYTPLPLEGELTLQIVSDRRRENVLRNNQLNGLGFPPHVSILLEKILPPAYALLKGRGLEHLRGVDIKALFLEAVGLDSLSNDVE